MSSDCEMYDPRELYSESDSDSESDCDCDSEIEREKREMEWEYLINYRHEYTVSFKVPLKTLGIVNRCIDEVIDKLIKDGELRKEDIDISIKQL